MSAAKYAVFARDHRTAVVDFFKPQDLNPREHRIITSSSDLHYLFGARDVTFVFLEGWYRNWRPIYAMEAWFVQYQGYAKDYRVEQSEVLRRNYARAQYGLPAVYEPDFYAMSHLSDPVERVRVSVPRLREGQSLLPGLDDKKRTVRPVPARAGEWVDALLLVAKSMARWDADRPTLHG